MQKEQGFTHHSDVASNVDLNIDLFDMSNMDIGVLSHFEKGRGNHDLIANASSALVSLVYSNIETGYDVKTNADLFSGSILDNLIQTNGTGITGEIMTSEVSPFYIQGNDISNLSSGTANGINLVGSGQVENFIIRDNIINNVSTSDGQSIGLSDVFSSIVSFNTILGGGTTVDGINLNNGGRSEISCNDITSANTGVHIGVSVENEYSQNDILNSSNPDLDFYGDVMLADGSLIRWNLLKNSLPWSIQYDVDGITGPQTHTMYNEWVDQSQWEVFHANPDQFPNSNADLCRFWYPPGAALGSIHYPDHNNKALFTFLSPIPINKPGCVLSDPNQFPSNPSLATLGIDSDSLYTEILSDTKFFNNYSLAQETGFKQMLYKTIHNNPDWLVGNSVLTNFYTQASNGFVGQSFAISDSLSSLFSIMQTQALYLKAWQSDLDSLKNLIIGYQEQMAVTQDSLTQDSLNALLNFAKMEADSIGTLVSDQQTMDSLANSAVIQNIESLNNALPSGTDHQFSEKTLNQFTLMELNGENLSSSDSTDLQTIAQYCYEDGGRFVFSARGLALSKLGEYFDESNCQQSSSLKTGNTIVAEPYTEWMRLSPNPAKDFLQIELSPGLISDNPIRIRVIDAYGHEIITRSLNLVGKSSVNIDLDDIPNGLYFLTVDFESQPITKPFVIVK